MTERTGTNRDCMEQIRTALDNLTAEVVKLHKVIDGNGEPGLKEQAMLNTAHRERMERIIDGLWLKVLLIWFSSMATIGALIKFLAGR